MFTTFATIVILFVYHIWFTEGLTNQLIKYTLLILGLWGAVESLMHWGFIFSLN
jgi:hypothetical protein